MHVVRVENLVRGMGESLVQPSPCRDNKLILFPYKYTHVKVTKVRRYLCTLLRVTSTKVDLISELNFSLLP